MRICRAVMAALATVFLLGAGAGEHSAERLLIDDFENSEVGQLPTGWDWHADDDGRDIPYAVEQLNGNKYLAAHDHGQSVTLGKKIRVDIDRYPYLAFRWRVHQLPRNGDERYGASGDSAAAVYVIYRKKMGFIPITVKYVWSTTLPVGTALQRSGIGRPWIIVAGSGEKGLGEWQTQVFDVRAAYQETFGKKAPHKIIAIAVLSDANATGSQASADYDDLCFLSTADAGSGIQQVVTAD